MMTLQSYLCRTRFWSPWGAAVLLGLHMVGTAPSAIAQITPDGTLAGSGDPNSSVNAAIINGSPAMLIQGGATRSDALFHSFQDFNVLAGERVYFDDTVGIKTIFSRVTGDTLSNIFGTLGVNGAADLFLLNPNGIVFGTDAQLDIDGSFVATTAEAIDFGNGRLFSAATAEAAPLLTLNTPIGLQYGTGPGAIRVDGTGSQIVVDPITGLLDETRFRPDGLAVPAGHSLSLLGGDITVEGGNLTSAGGTVELAAIAAGYLPLASDAAGFLPFQLTATVPNIDLPAATQLGNLQVTNASSISVSGDPAGNVRLLADTIDVTNGSAILMHTLGSTDSGSLQAIAPSSLTIQGSAYSGAPPPPPPLSPMLPPDYIPVITSTWIALGPAGSSGDGADIAINTDRLDISGGGMLITRTDGDGDAGDVTIAAQDITIGAMDLSTNLSIVNSFVGVNANGNGGDIIIDTNRLALIEGSITGVQTRGNGDAGDVTITATESVILDSQLPEFAVFPALTILSTAAAPTSVFGSSAPPAGNAGDISITTPSLSLFNGSRLRSSNSGTGNGGDITIAANSVVVDGTGDGFGSIISFVPLEIATVERPSLISAEVSDPGTGNAGAIRIDTARLQVSNGAQLSNSSAGAGTGGDVAIAARDAIELTGTSETGAASGIFSQAIVGNGTGGDILLVTPELRIQDGATVDVGNIDQSGTDAPGTGPAGNIKIEATTVQLDRGSLNADTLSGQQGNVIVTADRLTLDNASRISSSAMGTGSGGNIKITTDSLNLYNDSNLMANADGSGNAGDIIVNAPRQLYLSNSQITASGGQGNLHFTTPVMLLRDGSLVATDARGSAVGGNILIDTDFLIALENSDITANAEASFGGQIVVNAQSLIGTDYRLQLSPESDITASSELGPDLQGTVRLNTLTVDLAQGLSVLAPEFSGADTVAKSCADAARTNVLITTGRGGVAASPSQSLRSSSLWIDRRLPSSQQLATGLATDDDVAPRSNTIVEAQTVFRERASLVAASAIAAEQPSFCR